MYYFTKNILPSRFSSQNILNATRMIFKESQNYPESPELLSVVNDGHQLKLEYDYGTNVELKRPPSISVDIDKIYRPIQYLGAKFRTLPIILSKTLDIIAPDTYVIDLFSGSSIVSQVFNTNGLNVIANDALKFNSVFAKTLLNIDRKDNDIQLLSFKQLKSYSLSSELLQPFQKLISIETDLLDKKDTQVLLNLYSNLPQIWKPNVEKSQEIENQFQLISKNIGKPAFGLPPLFANFYAGTYYSIAQAIEIDRIRGGIENLLLSNEVSKWQYYFLLTCLLTASSKVVYTAGKHFAQPIKPENILKTEILNRRFYDDRTKDVWNEFQKSFYFLKSICENNFRSKSNIVLSNTMEEIISETSILPKVSVIYADPPYTAQQYSRYYHIPEVLYNYSYPKLQMVDGKITSGIYPDNKYKSRFCSKKDAYFAFKDLFKLASELQSSLIISYSSSLTEATGNIRMIAFEQIIELGNLHLPNCTVDVLKFDFLYRQLNKSNNIIKHKEDKEFLIVFKQS